jgi:trimeric autotransporter adhesin
MSFCQSIYGNLENPGFTYTSTNISAENASFTNLSATNASITNLTTTTFSPTNVNTSNVYSNTINTSLANASTANVSTAHISTVNVSSFNVSNISVDNGTFDNLYIQEQSVVLTDRSVITRDANQVMFIGKSDASDVTGADFLFRTGLANDVVKLLISRASDVVQMIALEVTTTLDAGHTNVSSINCSDLVVADTTQLEELEVLSSADIANLTVIGANGLNATKGRIINFSSTNSSLVNVSATTITATTLKGNIFTNLSAGTNMGLSQSSGFTTISTLAQVEFDDLTLESLNMLDTTNGDPTILSRTSNIINFIGTTNNTPLSMNFFMKNFTTTAPLLVLNGTNVRAEVNGNLSVSGTIKGNLSQNLLAGAGINLSTNVATGITTITNSGIVTDPLNVSTLNASNVNASTITGNIGGNLLGGAGINISTSANTGITTITNTGIITDPLNLSTLNGSVVNASTMNVSVLNPGYIEGFTKSTYQQRI